MEQGNRNINFSIVKNVFRQDLRKVYDKGFNDLHLMVLVYMQRFRAINTNTMTFNLGWLQDDLRISNSTTKQDINRALFELEEMKLIQLINDLDIENFDRNTRIVASLCDYENNFTLIDNDAIDKIFSLDLDIRARRTMLFLYCNIASRIDYKGYCYPSWNSFSRDLNVKGADNRINDALVSLKELGLIHYGSVGEVILRDGTRTKGNNIYVVCVDDDHMKHFNKGIANRRKQYENESAKIFKNETANLQRSVKQTINPLIKKYNNQSISASEIERLNELELEYYNLVKSNPERLLELKDEFITIALDEKLELANSRIETELEKERKIEEVLKLF